MMSKEEREEKRLAKLQEKEEKKNLKIYEKYMEQALKEAKRAYDINEVPIGCVIVQDDKIIARGYNRRNTDKSVLAHAEIAAYALLVDAKDEMAVQFYRHFGF